MFKETIKALLDKNLTLSIVESITAGGLCFEITKIPGSSLFFKGGLVAYSNEIKNKLTKTSLKQDVYNKAYSKKLVLGAKKFFNTDIAISTLGIAGPSNSSKDLKIGDVIISIAYKSKIETFLFNFKGNRNLIRKQVIEKVFFLLEKFVK